MEGRQERFRFGHPLGGLPFQVEPNKPRAIWDGRYVNEFCGEFPFHMDNTAKVAEIAWANAYFFKLAYLLNHLPFWTDEILKDHPHQQKILGWLTGVKIDEFLNSFASTIFQGEH